MRLSAFALAGVVGLAGGVFVSSCGPVRPACTPSSCSTGCCDGLTGRCVLDTSSTQCGQRGETCKACMLSEVCTLGVCSSSSLGGVGGGSAGGFTGGGSAGGFTGGGSAGGGSAGGFTGGGSAGGFTGGGSAGGFTGGGSAGGFTGGGSAGGFTGGGSAGGFTGGGSAGGFTGGGSAGGFGGGPPSCSTANCSSGCCSGTTCVQAPSNGTNQTCGFGGLPCATCGFGQTCNQVTLTCQGGSGGGTAGGSATGGGFAGGSSGGGPSGDGCFDVAPVTLFGNAAVVTGSLQGLFNDTSACSGAGPDIVYSVTLPQEGVLSAQVTTGGFIPRLNVRALCSSTTTLACATASASVSTSLTTPQLTPGTYFIWVDSAATSSGASFTLSLTFTPAGGTGGGGAGGGFAGGTAGGPGGSYVSSSIAASCDDLTFGATELLSASTSPVLSDDVATSVLNTPIVFPFFGTVTPFYGVQSNGMVQFFTSSASSVSTAFTNANIPSMSSPNGFAAPYWDDLYLMPRTPGAWIRRGVFSTGGSRFTVSWSEVAGAGTEFQAKFFATGVIEFHYCNMGSLTGSSATVGVEDPGGLTGTQPALPPVLTGSGIRFTP